jgi:hypothetical protein
MHKIPMMIRFMEVESLHHIKKWIKIKTETKYGTPSILLFPDSYDNFGNKVR